MLYVCDYCSHPINVVYFVLLVSSIVSMDMSSQPLHCNFLPCILPLLGIQIFDLCIVLQVSEKLRRQSTLETEKTHYKCILIGPTNGHGPINLNPLRACFITVDAELCVVCSWPWIAAAHADSGSFQQGSARTREAWTAHRRFESRANQWHLTWRAWSR